MTRRVTHDTREPIRATSGQIIGYVHRSEFVVPRRRSRHWLRRIDGWAIDERALQRAAMAGAETVVVIDLETRATYRATLGQLLAEGTLLDLGHGLQRALPASRWHVERPDALQLRLWA